MTSKTLLAAFFLGIAGSNLSALDYQTDILPIFAEKCNKCHTDEDGKDAKGGLALNNLPDMEEVYVGKYTTMRPGDPDESVLLDHISDPNSDDTMPPPGKGDRMTDEEILLVRNWLLAGAPIYPVKPMSSIPLAERPLMEWKSAAGTMIKAKFVRLSGDTLELMREDGKGMQVKLVQLDVDSQAQAKKLAGS